VLLCELRAPQQHHQKFPIPSPFLAFSSSRHNSWSSFLRLAQHSQTNLVIRKHLRLLGSQCWALPRFHAHQICCPVIFPRLPLLSRHGRLRWVYSQALKRTQWFWLCETLPHVVFTQPTHPMWEIFPRW
jgi:hypothetical protein